MDKIASETKIAAWSCLADKKEKLEFDLFDFSADQIAYLDRCLRSEDPKVRLTIEVEQKKLQIEPLTAVVRLVNVSLRTGGQKIKVADFTSPPSRAQALKQLTQNSTPLVVTIEEYQKQLFGGASDTPAETTTTAGDDGPTIYDVKLPKSYGAAVTITLERDDCDCWAASAEITIPHDEAKLVEVPQNNRAAALQATGESIVAWIRNHSTYARRQPCAQRVANQVKAWIDALQDAA